MSPDMHQPDDRDAPDEAPAAAAPEDAPTAVHESAPRPEDAPTAVHESTPRTEGLFRSPTDRMLFGVCGGIAERYGFEPLLVRLTFVATLFIGGAGALFYLAAALLIPGAPAATSTDFAGRPAGPAVAAASGVLRTLVTLAAGIGILTGLGAAAVLSLGTTAFFGAWPVAVLLLVVAVLLVVASARSRAATAGLLLLALALAVPATAATLGNVRIDRSLGDRIHRPMSPASAAAGYRLGAGHLTVDLRRTTFRRGSRTTVPVRLGAGRLGVILPDDRCVAWTVHTRMSVGDSVVLGLGNNASPFGNHDVVTEIDPPRGARDRRPRVTLDLRLRAGTVAVGSDQADISELPRFYSPGERRPTGRVLRSDGSFRTTACRAADRELDRR